MGIGPTAKEKHIEIHGKKEDSDQYKQAVVSKIVAKATRREGVVNIVAE